MAQDKIHYTARQRYEIAPTTPCCGRCNKDGKYAPFGPNPEDGGYCFQCNTTTPSNTYKKVNRTKETEQIIKKAEYEPEDFGYGDLNQFLLDLFNDNEIIKQNIFQVGEIKKFEWADFKHTVFQYYDKDNVLRGKKYIQYDKTTGKRIKQYFSKKDNSFKSTKIEYASAPEGTTNVIGFYGIDIAFALRDDIKKLAIVESEKSAIIFNAYYNFDNIVCVATGGTSSTTHNKLDEIVEWIGEDDDREVLIYCDCDRPGRDQAKNLHSTLKKLNIKSTIVDIAPNRWDGLDIADKIFYEIKEPDKLNILNMDQFIQETEVNEIKQSTIERLKKENNSLVENLNNVYDFKLDFFKYKNPLEKKNIF